jgi:integrase/recombinase XerD
VTVRVTVRVAGEGDRERRVPLSPTAQTALLRWLKERRMYGNPVSAWVWLPLSGQQYG